MPMTTPIRVLPIVLALFTAAVAVPACFEGDEAIQDLPCDDEGDCPGKTMCLPSELYSYNTCQVPQTAPEQCSPETAACNMLECCSGLMCNPDTITCVLPCTYGSTECAGGVDCCQYPQGGGQALCVC